MPEKQISIVGAGWLGFPLSKQLKELGWTVWASTRSQKKLQSLTTAGIKAVLLDLERPEQTDAKALSSLFSSEVFFFNLPPGRKKSESFFLDHLSYCLKQFKQQGGEKFVFVSSTSVYPDRKDWVHEEMELNEDDASNPSLLFAEKMVKKTFPKALILRPGGLMGFDRISGSYFAGKKDLPFWNVKVNYIHQVDAVAMISQFMHKEQWPEGIFNLVAPQHPSREEVYALNAQRHGFEMPSFDYQRQSDFKLVSGEKATQWLSYTFQYPDPRRFD